MVEVVDLAALKAASDGDYIEQTVRGETLRLYRTGLDSKGNLITRSERVAATATGFTTTTDETLNESITDKAIAPNTFTSGVESLVNTWVTPDIWIDPDLPVLTLPLNHRPYVFNLNVSDQYYLLPEAPSSSDANEHGKFVWVRNINTTNTFEIRASGLDNIQFNETGVFAVVIPPRTDAWFYQERHTYRAVLSASAVKEDEAGIDRAASDPILLQRLNQLVTDGATYALPTAVNGQWFSIIVSPGQTATVGTTLHTSNQHVITYWSDGQSWISNSPGVKWEVGERDSGDRFFDGEIIYDGFVRGAALADGQAIGISNVDHLLYYDGYGAAANGTQITVGFFAGTNRLGIWKDGVDNQLKIRTNWPISSFAFHCRYTKIP